MARPVFVEIPKRVGDYRVATGELNIKGLAAGAANVLGFIPGIGNTLEKGVRLIGDVVGRIFGTQKDEVRDVTRQILTEFFGAAMPGEVKMIGSARDVPELPNQYREEDIRRALDEISRTVLSNLQPGTDIHGDLSRAFNSYQFNSRDTSAGYLVLKFMADPTAGRSSEPAPSSGDGFSNRLLPDPLPSRTTSTDRHVETTDTGGREVAPGTIGGVSPLVLGLAAVVVVVLVSR